MSLRERTTIPPELKRILETEYDYGFGFQFLPEEDYDSLVFRAAFALEHNTMRRVSEVATPESILMGQFKWQNKATRPSLSTLFGTFVFYKSKTNQHK